MGVLRAAKIDQLMAAERIQMDRIDDIRPQGETLEGPTATDGRDSVAGSEQEEKQQEKKRRT